MAQGVSLISNGHFNEEYTIWQGPHCGESSTDLYMCVTETEVVLKQLSTDLMYVYYNGCI